MHLILTERFFCVFIVFLFRYHVQLICCVIGLEIKIPNVSLLNETQHQAFSSNPSSAFTVLENSAQ